MRKVIAAINLTVDGFCDHTAILPDEEIHRHYMDLLYEGDAILYGRTTYELMEFWQNLLLNPSGDKTMDDFANAMDQIPKIVFSRNLKSVNWQSAKLAQRSLETEVRALKQESGKPIFIGSKSLINQLMNLNLIDEYQFCIHPVLAGKGLTLFENIQTSKKLNLKSTKVFHSGAILLYYEAIEV